MHFERLIVRPLGADAIVEGEVMDPGLVASTIDTIFDEEGIAQRDVVVSVGGRDVIIKPIQMDRMKKSDAREVIRWEAEQHVPFDMDDVQLDFEITDPEGEGLQIKELHVTAAPGGGAQQLTERLFTDPALGPERKTAVAIAKTNLQPGETSRVFVVELSQGS